MSYASRASFVVRLMEAADFYINNATNGAALHATNFYRFGQQLLLNLCDPYDGFIKSLKPSFTGFMNGKLAKIPHGRRSIKQLYLIDMQLF